MLSIASSRFPVLRSLLFCPGNSVKMLQKSMAVTCDALVPDLEDSVPEEEKERGRVVLQGELEKMRTQAKAKC